MRGLGVDVTLTDWPAAIGNNKETPALEKSHVYFTWPG